MDAAGSTVIGEAFAAVIEDARRGDRAAIEALYRDLAPLVLGYLRGNRCPDADDAAAEAMVAVITGLSGFQGDERQFRSWALTIAHRRLVDQHRRSMRRPELLSAEPLPAAAPGSSADGEDEAMQRLRVAGILDAIDQLTPDQRAVLMLRALADLPIREIAEVTGKPETAVKALLRRATASVRRRLESEQEVL
jgi:RNA polymerase sigma-70 factor (ECF subfamily)